MKITAEIIQHLNKTLNELGVGFIYKFNGNSSISPTATIAVKDNGLGLVDSSIINCTNAYYDWLEKWFLEMYQIKIIFNNTRSIIWSDDFSKENE